MMPGMDEQYFQMVAELTPPTSSRLVDLYFIRVSDQSWKAPPASRREIISIFMSKSSIETGIDNCSILHALKKAPIVLGCILCILDPCDTYVQYPYPKAGTCAIVFISFAVEYKNSSQYRDFTRTINFTLQTILTTQSTRNRLSNLY